VTENITTAVSRIGAALGTFALPFGFAYWGIGPTMLVAAVLTAIGFFVCLFMAEETKGMTLAQAGSEAETEDPKAAPALQTN